MFSKSQNRARVEVSTPAGMVFIPSVYPNYGRDSDRCPWTRAVLFEPFRAPCTCLTTSNFSRLYPVDLIPQKIKLTDTYANRKHCNDLRQGATRAAERTWSFAR